LGQKLPFNFGKEYVVMTFSIVMFVLLGLFAGGLSGLIGIGGGVILVPSLVFLFGFTEHLAQGTTLALMVLPIGFLAARTYYKNGHVDLRVAALVCVGFTAGGFAGAKLAMHMSNALSEHLFGVLMIGIALRMLITTGNSQSGGASNSGGARSVTSQALLIVLGFAVGTLSGLLGFGGGVFLVPALVFFLGLSQHKAQGTTLALMVPPIGILASWQYFQQGDVNVAAAAWICAGFFVGALFGASLASKMPQKVLTRIFGVSMLIIALKMLFFAS
jgi:uncharacterized membrane protein YfcA